MLYFTICCGIKGIKHYGVYCYNKIIKTTHHFVVDYYTVTACLTVFYRIVRVMVVMDSTTNTSLSRKASV